MYLVALPPAHVIFCLLYFTDAKQQQHFFKSAVKRCRVNSKFLFCKGKNIFLNLLFEFATKYDVDVGFIFPSNT